MRLDRHLAPKISRMDGGFQKNSRPPKNNFTRFHYPPQTSGSLFASGEVLRCRRRVALLLPACWFAGGLSGDAGALAIRSAEQPGGWGQCGGGLLRHEPPSHPRTQRMKIGFRITTAARKTSSAQGANIAAETAAPRGCWPRDPRSGVVDKLR